VSPRWGMLLVIFFTRTSLGFQFQSIAALTPFLVTAFDFTWAQVGLLMGLFMLPGVVFALPGGLLGQRFGSLPITLAGLCLLIVGGMIVAYAGGFAGGAMGRALGGIGGVLVNIMLARMVAEWFRGRELQTAMGLMLAAWPFGMALALMLLGPLALLASWRVAEYATVVAAGLALGVMALIYRDPPGAGGDTLARPRLNVPARVWALAISAGVGWALLNASIIVVASFAPSFLIAQGASVTEAGLITGAALWISIVSVPLGGFLADRLERPRALIVGGCLIAAVTIACIAWAPRPSVWMIVSAVLLGVPPSIMAALLPRAVEGEHLATAFGVYYGLFYLGMAMAQSLAGLLRDLTGNPGMPLLFAALLMAFTVPAVALFWRIEARTAPPVPEEAEV
jgi:MFS family permease